MGWFINGKPQRINRASSARSPWAERPCSPSPPRRVLHNRLCAGTSGETPGRCCGRAAVLQAQEFYPLVALLDIGGDLWNQRHAVAARDHLHHRVRLLAPNVVPRRWSGRVQPSRKMPAPGRAGSGRPPAGSTGFGRCPRRQPAPSRCADRRRVPPAETGLRTGHGIDVGLANGSASSAASSTPLLMSSTSCRVWVSRNSSRNSGNRFCSRGRIRGSR